MIPKAIATTLVLIAAYPLAIVSVHDGDTFSGTIEVRPGLHETVVVRLPCGNAPELRADGGGVAAREALKNALDGGVDGGQLTLETEWKHEKYGRLLARPKRNGADVCSELVDAGWLQ